MNPSDDVQSVLRALRVPDAAIHSLYRCGSRVYGTWGARSDEDFVAVLASPGAKRDLLLSDGCDVIVHTRESFRDAIARHSLLALECVFAPAEHRLKETRPGFAFTLDRRKLSASALLRSTSDFAKAAKRFCDEPRPSKKKLFHALRVPMFALQIARNGRIVDYAEASAVWRRIERGPDVAWEPYRLAYGPLHARLTAELAELARR